MKRNYTILIPHYKTGKMTAYCLNQIFKHTHRAIKVVVIDNSQGEGLEYLQPYINKITLVTYPNTLMQSHGLAFDYAIAQGHVKTKYFITLESDSFPTDDNWLSYYDKLAMEGYDMAGSLLQLSGGEYIHPAGSMYRLENWKEAKADIEQHYKGFNFYSGYTQKDGHKYHFITTDTIPNIDLKSYLPIAQSVFHNGMGANEEHITTYGNRKSGQDNLLALKNNTNRIGYEPGQWFAYWHKLKGKKIKHIPTQVEWMLNRVSQQQEFTLTENGVKHIWGVTAYNGVAQEELNDIIIRKQTIMNELYERIT